MNCTSETTSSQRHGNQSQKERRGGKKEAEKEYLKK